MKQLSINKEERNISIDTIDRVRDIKQKEEALYTAGITRPVVYSGIAEGLQAVKKRTEIRDGQEVVIEEPDHLIRAKHREMALNALGDLENNKIIEGSKKISISINEEDINVLDKIARTLEDMNRSLNLLPIEMRGDIDIIEAEGDTIFKKLD